MIFHFFPGFSQDFPMATAPLSTGTFQRSTPSAVLAHFGGARSTPGAIGTVDTRLRRRKRVAGRVGL